MRTPGFKRSDRLAGLLRTPEARIFLAGVIGLFALVLLRGTSGTTATAAPFYITIAIFLIPGLALTYLFLGRRPSFAFRVPLALVLSVGVFGLPALFVLLSNQTFEIYLALCLMFLALSLALLVILALRRNNSPVDEVAAGENDDIRWWMWGPFALIGLVFALISATGNLTYGNDEWVYLGYIRDFLAPGNLAVYEPFYGEVASFNRIYMSGWILEQAAFSRISGLDPVPMALTYLPPVVMVCAVAASYFVAKAVLVEARPVLIASSLSVLLPLLQYLRTGSPAFFDGNFFIGITMDKQVIHFVFFPVAVGLAVMFLRERRWQYLLLFSLTCGAMMLVHPIGLVVLCFTLAGVGAGYLLFNLRRFPAWASLSMLALAPTVIVLPAVAYLVSTGISLIELRGSMANYYSTDTSMIGYLSLVGEKGGTLRFFEDGSFMLNPKGLLNPVDLVTLVASLLFLVWRVRRSFTAQLLLGLLVFILVLVYLPPLATFVGTYLGPSQLARLAWGINLVVSLTLGWMVSDFLDFLSVRMSSGGLSRRLSLPVSGVLTFAITAGVTVGALIFASPGAAAHLAQANKPPPRTCLEPVYRWIGKTIDEPSVVLARDRENSCIPVYSADANVVSIRGGRLISEREELEKVSSEKVEIPERALEAYRFSNATELDEDLVRLIQRNRVDYVLVTRPNLERDIESGIRQGGEILSRTDSPKGKYNVYRVNQRELEAYLEAQDR